MHTHSQILIVKEVESFILEQFNRYQNPHLLYHNYQHTAKVVELIEEIGIASGLNEEDLEVVKIAGWFHDIGYLHNMEAHENEGIRMMTNFMRDENYPEYKIKQIAHCIEATKMGVTPRTAEAEIVADADMAYSIVNSEEVAPLLRLEWQLTREKKYTNNRWQKMQLDFLLGVHFYTAYSKQTFTPILSQHIVSQNELVVAIEKQKGTEKGKFANLDGMQSAQVSQTFLKTSYQNYLQKSAIVSNNANFMMGISAISIVFLCGVLAVTSLTNLWYFLPIGIFVTFNLTTFAIAMWAARLSEQGSVFSSLQDLSLKEFEFTMDRVLRNSTLLYGNMVRSIYFLGKSLEEKQGLLQIAYVVFGSGTILTCLAFVVLQYVG